MMWIGVAFMLLAVVGMVVMSAIGIANTASTSPFGGKEFLLIAVIYAVMAFVYVFPAIKLWKFANLIGSLVSSSSLADLDAALNEQRSFWKFIGIMVIIMISLYVVMIIGAVAFATFAAAKAGSLPH